jgi:opacity protein-like surface antigen
MKKISLLCIAALVISNLTLAENITKVGTTAAPFLQIGVGSRATAMGGAFVAVANDATAIYWNPGGMSRLPLNEVVLIHSEWLADTKFDFVGIILPLGQFGTLGASLTSLDMGEMKVRTIEEPEGTGEMFSASDLAMGLSYARNLTERFSIGFNAKYIQQKIWHMSASSIAVDIGVLFRTQFNDMTIGMSISNFGDKMKMEGKDTMVQHDIDPEHLGNNDRINAHLDTDSWALPLIFRVGVAMEVISFGSNNHLTMAVDAIHPNDQSEYINTGMEYVTNDMFFLRVGYKSLFMKDNEAGFSAGAGMKYNLTGNVNIKMDYAYADFGRLENVQRFSLGLTF